MAFIVCFHFKSDPSCTFTTMKCYPYLFKTYFKLTFSVRQSIIDTTEHSPGLFILAARTYTWVVIRIPDRQGQKPRIPYPSFGESRFPRCSQIPFLVKMFCVFPNPTPYYHHIPYPENNLPDIVNTFSLLNFWRILLVINFVNLIKSSLERPVKVLEQPPHFPAGIFLRFFFFFVLSCKLKNNKNSIEQMRQYKYSSNESTRNKRQLFYRTLNFLHNFYLNTNTHLV